MPYHFNPFTKKLDYSEHTKDVTTAGLVLAMNFNPETLIGTAGSEKVLDSSGYNNHGQNYGATTTSGFNDGGALSFDGTNNYVSIPSNDSLNVGTGNFTVSFWVYRQDTGIGVIISKKNDGTAGSAGWALYVNNNNGILYCNNSDGTTEQWFYTATGLIPLEIWTKVDYVREGTNWKVFINGTLITTYSVASVINLNNTINLKIGEYGGGDANFYGRIDEVCIYNNRALTIDEVKQFYLQRKEFYNSFVSQKNVHVDSNGNVAVNKTTANASFDVNGFILHNGKSRVTTQFNKTDTTLTNITELSATLVAGKTYKFTVNLFVNADATGGHKYAMSGTVTATNIIYQINSISNTTNLNIINSRQTALGGSAGQAGATVIHTIIEGLIVVNAGGTLTCQFAQNVASGTSSVLVGSNMIVEQIL